MKNKSESSNLNGAADDGGGACCCNGDNDSEEDADVVDETDNAGDGSPSICGMETVLLGGWSVMPPTTCPTAGWEAMICCACTHDGSWYGGSHRFGVRHCPLSGISGGGA